MKKKILFILNPISGGIKKKSILSLIKNYLDLNFYHPEFKQTKKRGDGFFFAKKAVKNNFFCIAAVGGDGTVNEVARALIGSKTKLAIIPAGSGNGFASYFKINLNIQSAITIINSRKSLDVDVCFLNKKPYFNLAGFGFSAIIAKETHAYRKRGVWIYLKTILLNFFSFTPSLYHIHFENKSIVKKCFLLEFANAQIWGKSTNIAPLANPCDGEFEVCYILPFPWWQTPILLLRLITKSIHKSPYYYRKRAKKINLISEDKLAHIDGESVLVKKDIRFRIQKEALNLLVP